jgi:hypothetical protein
MMQRLDAFERIGRALACLALVAWSSAALMAQSDGGIKTPTSGSPVHVTHILGFQRIPHNANGDLSIQGGTLRFQKSGGPGAQISVGSIQEVSLGASDKQVGGVPLALGRTAAPFGGGRVVALFSHKKYDTLTLEYLDTTGALHGAIFQLNKGQGQGLKTELIAEGAQSTPKAENEDK